MRNILQVVPRWKLVLYLFASVFLTIVSTYMVTQSVRNFVFNSVTLSGLWEELTRLIGVYKFNLFMVDYGGLLYLLLNGVIFLFYLLLFYYHIQNMVYRHQSSEIVDQVGFIAEGNFDHQLESSNIPEFKELANHVNGIVAKLQQSLEEERLAEQAKKDLITNVSHDLRTPLTSITGFLGLIEQDRYKDETELRYYVTSAAEKANRLQQLLDDLFEYTRVQNRGLKVKKAPIDLGEMLAQLAVQFRLEMIEAGMECRVFIPKEKLMVEADGTKLARVFENLISNALKYGSEGKFIDLYAKVDAEKIKIEIINYGNPISSLDLPFIFERFYRVEKSRSDSDKSSGLGLAIAKGMVELHGGTIGVESDQERTVFTVTLPKL
ncbi:sensor histidine kinase [Neobacillus sp. K501]